MRKYLFNLLKIVFSVGLIAVIFIFLVDIKAVIVEMRQANLIYLVLAATLMILGTMLRSLRWDVLLKKLDIHVPIPRLIYLYFVGSLFNLFLPTGMGGDAVKMAMLGRYTGKVPEAIGTTLVDRATGLWVLFVLALIVLPFSGGILPQSSILIIMLITITGAVGGFIVMGTPFLPWLGSKIRLPMQDKLDRFYRSVAELGYRVLGKACLVSLTFNIMLIAFNYLIARSYGVQLPISIFILFTPILSVSLAIPVSISGFGARETVYIALYSAVGVSPDLAIAMSLTDYVLTYLVTGIIGGVWYAISSLQNAVKKESVAVTPEESPKA